MRTTRRLTRIALSLAPAIVTLPMLGCSWDTGYHAGYGHYGYYEHSRARCGGYQTQYTSGDALALYSAIMLTYHATAWLVDCLD